MYSLRKLLFTLSKFPKTQFDFRCVPEDLKYFCHNSINNEKAPTDSDKNKDKVPGPMTKYELFSEQDLQQVLDIEKEREKIQEPVPKTYDNFAGIKLTRGVTGVFDIEELVDVLRNEKAKDIFVCEIPPEYNYVDYMVIVTGRSRRHMIAMAEFIRKIFKRKVNRMDRLPIIEGKNCKKWLALDLENIVLHIFSEESRKEYDLETLWSLGKEFDSLSHKQSSSMFSDYSNLLSSLLSQQNKT